MALKDLTTKEIYLIEFYVKRQGWQTWRGIAFSMGQALEEKRLMFPNHQMPEDCRIVKFTRDNNDP